MIRKINERDADEIAKIHHAALNNTFLSSLGLGFLAGMYTALADDPKSILFVAEEDGEVAGFISCILDSDTFIRRIVLKSPIKLSLPIGYQIIKKPSTIKKILQTLSYGKLCFIENADTELLAIAVMPKFQREGIGSSLFNALLEELKLRKMKKLKVLVGQELESAQCFYKKNNFIYQKTITLYGMKKDILVKDID